MSIEAPPLERKLVAILAADVEGYSRMMHDDEVATLTTLSAHRAVIDGLIAAAGGHIKSTAGDSVLAEFASVVEAVVCAVEIQRTLVVSNEPLPAGRRMLFRIGINVGDVMVKDGGIFGDGVNVASRVEGIAPPGGICVTRGVRDHVLDRLPYRFEDRGDHAVKNIARPVHVYRVAFDEREVGELPVELVMEPPLNPLEPVEVELTFWKSVEAGGTPDEYRAYLERYPSGSFAALAEARLEASPVAAEPEPDLTVELAFWDAVKDGDDPALFAAYIEKFPRGEFVTIAKIKLKSVGGGSA